jgi:hypothetical protein
MKQLEKLLLMPGYFRALAKQWLNILFGETLVGIGFLIWWALGAPTNHALIIVFVVAMFVAGYYAWRADHVRLLPQLSIGSVVVQETPTEASGEKRAVFVQVELICKDAPVEECRGHLLRVYKRYMGESEWTLTQMNERLDLEWSHKGCVPLTLYKSGGQNLNICSHGNGVSIIVPAVSPRPSRWREVFDSTGSFRFDIELTAKDCAPISASVSVSLDGCKWNEPKVEIL